MSVSEKAALIRLFEVSLEAGDEVACTGVIEEFAAAGDPIAEKLCDRLLTATSPYRVSNRTDGRK